MLLQAEQMHKMTSISLKMVEVVILSENNCHFVSCLACRHFKVFVRVHTVLTETIVLL